VRNVNELELIRTPKHGSWLNVAESGLSVLALQSIVAKEATAWYTDRNVRQTGVDSQFTITNARVKLKHLHPILHASQTTSPVA